jgi:hypothetical protein
MKRRPHRIALTALSAGVCLVLTGCFSYTKEESSHTATPAVEVPSENSSTTTTTTSSDDGGGAVQRERSTTIVIP